MTALKKCWDFLGGPVVKTLCFKAKDTSLIPGQEANTPHASKQYCDKFSKDFKNGPHWTFNFIVDKIHPNEWWWPLVYLGLPW